MKKKLKEKIFQDYEKKENFTNNLSSIKSKLQFNEKKRFSIGTKWIPIAISSLAVTIACVFVFTFTFSSQSKSNNELYDNNSTENYQSQDNKEADVKEESITETQENIGADAGAIIDQDNNESSSDTSE